MTNNKYITPYKNERNQSIDLLKYIAACIVVLSHVTFPGKVGTWGDFVRGVPFFLMISGYFSYSICDEKIRKRIRHILFLLLFSSILYFFWNIFDTKFFQGESITEYFVKTFTWNRIARWIFLDKNIFSTHLWYLSAILVVYILFWIYVRLSGEKTGYRWLYMFGSACFLIYFVMTVYVSGGGGTVKNLYYRNALLMALPMFAFGLGMREYQQRIQMKLNLTGGKLVLIAALGIVVGVIQRNGFGKTEVAIGMLVADMAIMFLAILHPVIFPYGSARDRLVSVLSQASVVIYIIHPMISRIFTRVLKMNHIAWRTSTWWAYSKPLVVILVSTIIGVAYVLMKNTYRKKRDRKLITE